MLHITLIYLNLSLISCSGLRKLVTPLLAGLLEVDPQRMWNFERFFQEVTMILSRKVVHVFLVNKVQPLTIYMDPEHRCVTPSLEILEYYYSDVPSFYHF